MNPTPSSAGPLQVLRLLFGTYLSMLAVLGVVAVLVGGDGDGDPLVFVGVIVGVALLTIVLERSLPSLSCASIPALQGSYRTRFLLRLALAEAPALIGFAATFVVEGWWIYLVGVAAALPGFVRAAPTARRLSRDRERLLADGCGLDLLEALGLGPAGPLG